MADKKDAKALAAANIWGGPLEDLVEVGANPFHLIHEASSEAEGWKKTTEAMKITGIAGCIIKTTTKQRNVDGSYAISEALAFFPGVGELTDG
ncbi:hypothetical protein KAR91_33715 [Candidatus Pacearchaeota archaeon]|nr:hypothetical protein [Candidatus Pacearchaeota archaeon]